MYFAIGFCGALACLAMFGAGTFAGWQIYRRTRPNPADTEARDELDAFRRLQNYTVDDAYGRNQQEE
ncbi:MAG: hypothetical protein IJR72_01865 [Oscillospiraceae bacterium]|nr:hypothetical protein [Oscillospiraceae bacterium]